MTSRLAIAICIALAALSGAVSFLATRTKGPTYDEPTHLGAAYAHRFLSDNRIDAENPVLWKLWVTIPMSQNDLVVDPSSKGWLAAGDTFPDPNWTHKAMFDRDWHQGMALLNRSRFVMVIVSMALCLLTAWWAHAIAGPWAALATTVLFALDPTFLAHASIVKNDIAVSLAMLAAVIAMWRAGRRLTVLNGLTMILASAVSLDVKFSAVLVPGIVALGLICRALVATPWIVLGRTLRSRGQRLMVAPAILALVAMFTFGLTWAAYGFRYDPSPDPSLHIEIYRPLAGGIDPLFLFALRHHLLPEAYCIGFLRQHVAIQSTWNYLFGAVRREGCWYYFPVAFVVKTPIATLVAILLSVALAMKWRLAPRSPETRWSAICIGLPLAIYLLSAMSSDYNHGIRNLLPIFPMIFISVGIIFAIALKRRPRTTGALSALLCIGLAAETLAAFPDYLPFFNVAAGGSRGGLRLLGDSNLDWGQDLPLIAQWQHEHPQTRLYLGYFGALEPKLFGIDYIPLPGFWVGKGEAAPDPKQPGVLAISATYLQGLYIRDPWNGLYAEIKTWKPREVLGGTIYVYDFPSPEMGKYR